jgi:hypothetical protein
VEEAKAAAPDVFEAAAAFTFVKARHRFAALRT